MMNPFQKRGLMAVGLGILESQKAHKAAVMIQTNFRRYTARKRYASLIYCNYIKRANVPAIKMQSAWRKYSAICSAKLLALSRSVVGYYDSQATKIASWYKGNRRQ